MYAKHVFFKYDRLHFPAVNEAGSPFTSKSGGLVVSNGSKS